MSMKPTSMTTTLAKAFSTPMRAGALKRTGR